MIELKCLQGMSMCGTASLHPYIFSLLVLVSLLWIHGHGGHLIALQLKMNVIWVGLLMQPNWQDSGVVELMIQFFLVYGYNWIHPTT
jgi:hypothetical protein